MSNVVENVVPYVTYRWAEYKAMKADEQIKRDTGEKAPESHAMEIEKQYLSPKYAATIGDDFEDGLFNGMLFHSLSISPQCVEILCSTPSPSHLHAMTELDHETHR